ncbi:MAG: tRNA 5-methoxyuridine(34)/uridine 5-oxyacetic acid(34) synthase CmoB [Gammaproteobacteria bacterium]|nr:tRNA 5-methoxyuridine(34)/uridine 5-oxyacetic acid(34) synthase CmoB [Gammaproteobacteria bacterium]
MINFDDFYRDLQRFDLGSLQAPLQQPLTDILSKKNGNLPRWLPAIETMPAVTPSTVELGDTINIGQRDDVTDQQRQQIEQNLRLLMPWRKGPFSFFDIFIDTEWRSDWKWQRVLPHLSSLEGRRILDIGCGSGYHLWRMWQQRAEFVVGIDPSLLFLMQFRAAKQFIGDCPVHLLPLGIEHLPTEMACFDTVFSMGVFYHRRSPIDHLLELKACLKPGGELVLETLIVEGGLGHTLVPEDRYAQMRNVWFIPSCATLELWLRRCGFENIVLADLNQTTVHEQRQTDWMQFESLPQFLQPDDHNLTIEGYPAPTRATFIARKP